MTGGRGMLTLHSTYSMVTRKHSQWNIPLPPSKGGFFYWGPKSLVTLSKAKNLNTQAEYID